MEMRLEKGVDKRVIDEIINVINEFSNGDLSKSLENTTLYISGHSGSETSNEIITLLEENGMKDKIPFFQNSEFDATEIVFCIPNDGLEYIIAKMGVENGNGHATMSIIHFIERFIRILQSNGVIKVLMPREERVILERIFHEIPRRVSNTKVVNIARDYDRSLQYFT